MFVTVELLDKLEACEKERGRFAELFPQGVELTRELIVQHAQEFNWTWCAANLAGDAGWAVYDQAEEQARTVYDRVAGAASAVYWQPDEAAYATYQQAIAPAYAAYNLACATAFADALGL